VVEIPAYPRMKTTNEGEDWFHLFQKGDEHAFRKVFDKYYRSVSYFAQKILNDDIYAEDIVSDSFRKAWDARSKFATHRHLENFLYLVTRNGCISHLRSLRVTQSTDQEWVRLSGEGEANTALDLERVQTRLMELIYEKLTELPGGDILRMSFIEGKSTKEIATEMKITENNVYILKSRSLKVLRTMLTRKEWAFLILIFFTR
jgi:RNA polymerase sigma factor (sigma-70 family)